MVLPILLNYHSSYVFAHTHHSTHVLLNNSFEMSFQLSESVKYSGIEVMPTGPIHDLHTLKPLQVHRISDRHYILKKNLEVENRHSSCLLPIFSPNPNGYINMDIKHLFPIQKTGAHTLPFPNYC